LGRNQFDERKSEIRSSTILLINFSAAADRQLPATASTSLELWQASPYSALAEVVAFSGVVAGNFATGECVPPAVTLRASCLAGASTATQKSQHSKQRATSKASGPQIFSIRVFLTVSEPVPRRKLLG
jgi:hypothetical protein